MKKQAVATPIVFHECSSDSTHKNEEILFDTDGTDRIKNIILKIKETFNAFVEN
jgi:hypothetical protein